MFKINHFNYINSNSQSIRNLLNKPLKSTRLLYNHSIKNFGIASFYSKYVIIGSGYAGMTLLKLLTSVNIIFSFSNTY